jgi:hypothetical protein
MLCSHSAEPVIFSGAPGGLRFPEWRAGTIEKPIHPVAAAARVVVLAHRLARLRPESSPPERRTLRSQDSVPDSAPSTRHRISHRRGEILIPLGPMLLLEKFVGRFHGGDLGQTQMLHQAIAVVKRNFLLGSKRNFLFGRDTPEASREPGRLC